MTNEEIEELIQKIAEMEAKTQATLDDLDEAVQFRGIQRVLELRRMRFAFEHWDEIIAGESAERGARGPELAAYRVNYLRVLSRNVDIAERQAVAMEAQAAAMENIANAIRSLRAGPLERALNGR